jgi:hypothetical protein
MPTSDMIFFVLGVADYIFLLLFIVGTGIVTRRNARAAEKHKATEAANAPGETRGGKVA